MNEQARKILENRKELFFFFKADGNELELFSRLLSIDGFDGKNIYAYANPAQFERFLETGRIYSVVESYYDKNKAIDMAATIEQMQNWDRYPYYEVYVEMMQKFALDFPEICRLDTIGYSHDGRLILVVHITAENDEPDSKPEFLYTGQMHGDELVSGFLFLRLIDYLLNNYETDPQINKLLTELNIYINPYSNPDGTWYGGNNNMSESRRNNAQDIDINRNFPDPIAGPNPDGNPHTPETALFIQFADQRNFIMSGNSHSGAECMNYPFDTYSVLPADNDWWYFVSREYADNAQQNSPPGYFTDLNNGVTHGYSWYSITGGRQDYMNYFHSCREVTMELSTQKKVDSELLPQYWNYNRKAMLDYMEQASYGLRGVVTDSITNLPLKAEVFILNHDFFNSEVKSNSYTGWYYRLLYEGNYHVTFSAEGYKSKTIEVNMQNYEKTILDVQLVNLEMLPPHVSFYAEPIYAECNPHIKFINSSEASESTTWQWDFGDGTISVEKNPVHFYKKNGSYNVVLIGENANGQESFERTLYIEINLPEIDAPESVIICEEEGIATINIDAEGEIFWYYELNDEDAFHTGNSFTTPLLSESLSYYVQSYSEGETSHIGEANNSAGGSFVSNYSTHFLVFDCFIDCVLETVKVYAQDDGERIIYLRDTNGDIREIKNVFIEAGEQEIYLGFNLIPGENYSIGCYGPSGLYRGFSGWTSNFDFPYSNAYLSIKRSNTTFWNDHTKFYSYFYNWKIKAKDCYSSRAEINVFVNELVLAEFDFSVAGLQVSFNNNSTAADTYLWDFGDGNQSTESNPIHIYESEGEYIVSLTAQSECGSDQMFKSIFVQTGINSFGENRFDIWPNPADNIIFVKTYNHPAEITVCNSYGISLYKEFSNEEIKKINTQNFKPGIYFITVKTAKEIQIQKLIIRQ